MTLADDTGEVKTGSSRTAGRFSRFSSLDALLASRTPDPDDGFEDRVEHRVEHRVDTGIDAAPPPPPVLSPDGYDHRADDGGGLGRLLQLDVDSIRPNEFQPRRRFDEASLASLTDSVRELGVLQPILVRPVDRARIESGDGTAESTSIRFELIAGERRWRAARRAGLDRIPAIVREMADVRSLEEAIVENLHRADLNALEEAAAYQQLIDEFAFSQAQVAHRVGKSRSAVANTLRLLQLPGSVQRLVVEGTLSPGHARAVLSVQAGDRRAFAEKILSDALSVRQAEEMAQGWGSASSGYDVVVGGSTSHQAAGGPSGGKSVGALEVESLLEAHLDTRVVVSESRGGGRVSIDFADSDDLARIFQLLFRNRAASGD